MAFGEENTRKLARFGDARLSENMMRYNYDHPNKRSYRAMRAALKHKVAEKEERIPENQSRSRFFRKTAISDSDSDTNLHRHDLIGKLHRFTIIRLALYRACNTAEPRTRLRKHR